MEVAPCYILIEIIKNIWERIIIKSEQKLQLKKEFSFVDTKITQNNDFHEVQKYKCYSSKLIFFANLFLIRNVLLMKYIFSVEIYLYFKI